MANHPCNEKGCKDTAQRQCSKCDGWYCSQHRTRHSSSCDGTKTQAASASPDKDKNRGQDKAGTKPSDDKAPVYFDAKGNQLVSSVLPMPPACANPHSGDSKTIIPWLCKLADPTMEQKATLVFQHVLETLVKRPEYIFKNLVFTAYNAFRHKVAGYGSDPVFDFILLRVTDTAAYKDPFSGEFAEGSANAAGIILCLNCKGEYKIEKAAEDRASTVAHELAHFFCHQAFGDASPNGLDCESGDKPAMRTELEPKKKAAWKEFNDKVVKSSDAGAKQIAQSLKEYDKKTDKVKDAELLAHLVELQYLWGGKRFQTELPDSHGLLHFLFENDGWHGLKSLR